MEAAEPSGDRQQMRPFSRKDPPYRLVRQLGMFMRLGVGNAPIEQPAIEFIIARHLGTSINSMI